MRNIFYLLLITILLFSCKTKYYPATGNYVSKTKINILGNYNEKEKKLLEEKLSKQIDDSLQYSKRREKILGFFPYFVKVYHNFDSNSISRTKDFFKAAYVANGYFRGGITTSILEKEKNETNAYVITFNALPFQNHKIDKVEFNFRDTAIQKIVDSIKKESFIKKSSFYSQDLLDAERRRITAALKNSGYLNFNKEDIKVIADTINISLLKPTNDPFEQQALLEEALQFDENPNTDISFILRDTIKSFKLKKYYVGNIIVQPDNIDNDITPPNKVIIAGTNIEKQFFVNAFKDNIMSDNIFLKRGDLFKQENIDKSYDAFNYLGVWKQVIITPIIRSNNSDSVDFKITMLPFNRFLREIKIEGSYSPNNSSNTFIINLWGINTSINFKDKNLWRQATQSTITPFGNVEFGNNRATGEKRIINTLQLGIGYSLNHPKFPKFIPYNPKKNTAIQNPRSFFNTSVSYTKRLEFFDLADITFSPGLQFKYQKKWNVQLGLLNAEYKYLLPKQGLRDQLITSPNLKFIYNDGIVISPIKSSVNKDNNKFKLSKRDSSKIENLSSVRYNFEVAVAPVNTNRNFNFVKLEYDRRFNWIRPKVWYALRIYGGIGNAIFSNKTKNDYLPFFRQFIGGGPNSLRAWNVRGIGSYSTRTGATDFKEFFGDIQSETNFELRHSIGKVIGIPIRGAAFLDMGNIWNWKAVDATQIPTGMSLLNKVYNDIAVAGGYGFRIDFDYFILRLDLGMKLKEPTPLGGGGGWFNKENFKISRKDLSDIKLQLGIGYPF